MSPRAAWQQNEDQLLRVTVDAGASFRAAPPELLFAGDHRRPMSLGMAPTFDVSPDGRFLMMKEARSDDGGRLAQVIVVLHWIEELKRLVPVN